MTKQKRLRHNEYYDTQKIFDGLYAKSLRKENFYHLMDIISSPQNIKLAYRNIKNNSGSKTYGTDRVTIDDIKAIPTDKYVGMVQRKLSYYKPKPVRRKEIKKPNGGIRPLGIPTMIDRLVQQCILQVLEPIGEAKFHERNNGFRPNRSTENAIAQCYKMIQVQNLHFVVDIDIKGFFDNVNHSKLIRQMWNMGVRDKQLLCIIKEMLKAPIVMPNGDIQYPTCGIPQGGVLSPLLSNIVLNELDWWIASQWENIPTRKPYRISINKSGSECKSDVYRSLRRTNLKEMYIIRYADDFKIFCRKRSDADKVFQAIKQWLQERLKLQISEEKSKVVNLRKHYSEFLGFRIKAVKKGKKYAVCSHMREKAVKRATERLKEQVKRIQNPKDIKTSVFEIHKYNQMVEGIQNYYRFATNITTDCSKIQRVLSAVIINRLKERVSRTGEIHSLHFKERYGRSKQMRFVNGEPIIPIGYVQTKNPMYKKRSICKYTKQGREEIHKSLKFDEYVLYVMEQLLYDYKTTDSIEYTDNRISVYTAQRGKCAILGEILEIENIHCHHKIPKYMGGKDNYQNLIIVHKDIHILVHARKQGTITTYLAELNLNKEQINKLNSLRILAGNEAI